MEWYRDPHLELDFERGSACLDGNGMSFTRKEYELLSMLAQNAGEIIPRELLLLQVWATAGRSGRVRWTCTFAACARNWGPTSTVS